MDVINLSPTISVLLVPEETLPVIIQAQRGWCAAAPERSVQAIRYVK